MWDSGCKGSYEPRAAGRDHQPVDARGPAALAHEEAHHTVIGDPWPITEWSGYQMDWNRGDPPPQPGRPAADGSLDLSGFDAYNGY